VNTSDLVTRKINENEKFTALAFKMMNDPLLEKLTFSEYTQVNWKPVLMFTILSVRKRKESAVCLQMHANHREEVSSVRAGDIAAAIGLKYTRTGDTLCSEDDPLLWKKNYIP